MLWWISSSSVVVILMMSRTSMALSGSSAVVYTDVALQAAADITTRQLDRLHAAGALNVNRPIQIRAERLDGAASTTDVVFNDHDTKIIHFQRHGQGYHNLLGDVWRELGNPIDMDSPDPTKNPFVRPEIVDAPLTEKGRQECAAWQMEASLLNPEVVIVSPLHRAIQTSYITFADHLQSNKKNIPWVAHEGCREELGLLVCNKRRPLSETKVEFPRVDFTHMGPEEEDTLWHPTEREPVISKSERIYSFLVDFVRNRPEKEMAVVGHSAWLFNMCNAVMDCGEDESLMSWFLTSEIRSMRVSFQEQPIPVEQE